jgi:hypothetical protein
MWAEALAGLLVVVGGIALVFGVLGFVLYKVRASGRSASRGHGTGEGGTAFHAGTRPGPEFGSTRVEGDHACGTQHHARPDQD